MPALRRNRNFVLLAVGQGVSRLGDGVYAAALVWTAFGVAVLPLVTREGALLGAARGHQP